VLDCTCNAAAISEVAAIDVVAMSMPNVESISVALLPQSLVANEFKKSGYLIREVRNTGETTENTTWSAIWLPTHPAATAFSSTELWSTWPAWSHH
jgi:hypothetical protein